MSCLKRRAQATGDLNARELEGDGSHYLFSCGTRTAVEPKMLRVGDLTEGKKEPSRLQALDWGKGGLDLAPHSLDTYH